MEQVIDYFQKMDKVFLFGGLHEAEVFDAWVKISQCLVFGR